MNGVIVLDKPEGITSRAAVNTVNRLLKIKKSGHTGTLDPFATGVLPICINDATKIIPFMNSGYKKYEALIRLGVRTDTMDLTGKVLSEEPPPDIDKIALQGVFSKFIGKINQIPPMFSALKKGGVRLYDYARKGVEVERAPRSVTIKELELLDLNPPFIRIMVKCSRGTYVRVLASDIADELGCGGHLAELRRIESDGFGLERAVTIEDLTNGVVRFMPLEDALSHMARVEVGRDVAMEIRAGKQIRKTSLKNIGIPDFKTGDKLGVYEDGKLISVTEASMDASGLGAAEDGEVVLRLLRVLN